MDGVYAYVDGSDLEGVFAQIEAAGHEFLVSRAWSVPARFVSTHFARTPDLAEDDLADWHLGFNLDLPIGEVHDSACQDIRAVARFVADLYPACQREFVFGIFNRRTNTDQDFVFIGNDPGPVEEFIDVLRQQSSRVPAA
jgi:hypothetical protein